MNTITIMRLCWIFFLSVACHNQAEFKPTTTPPVAMDVLPSQAPGTIVVADEPFTPVAELYDVELSETLTLMVDIIFAIDESASMDDETAAVSNHLTNMLATFNNGRLDPTKIVRIDATIGSKNDRIIRHLANGNALLVTEPICVVTSAMLTFQVS